MQNKYIRGFSRAPLLGTTFNDFLFRIFLVNI